MGSYLHADTYIMHANSCIHVAPYPKENVPKSIKFHPGALKAKAADVKVCLFCLRRHLTRYRLTVR